jgi:carboxypeptidase C (cathepsin A)
LIGSFVRRIAGPPKYLIGESYGTTRVSGLALELQENNGCTSME